MLPKGKKIASAFKNHQLLPKEAYRSRFLDRTYVTELSHDQVHRLENEGATVVPSRRYMPVVDLNLVYRAYDGPRGDPNEQGTLDDVIEHIAAPPVWEKGFNGAGVSIAIVDTGVNGTRGEIGLKRQSRFQTFRGDNAWIDEVGHGTMVACIAAGAKEDGGRYNGVAPGARIISCRTTLSDLDLFEAYEELLTHYEEGLIQGRLIINNSFGTYDDKPVGEPDPFRDLIKDNVIPAGISVVFAAGNNHHQVCRFQPFEDRRGSIWGANSLDEVLTVGTVDRDNENTKSPPSQEEFSHCDSSRGPGEHSSRTKPDFVAPTYGDVPWGEGYERMHWWGTSGAAPQVSGLCALLLQAEPELPAEDLRLLISETCDKIEGSSNCVGAGVINCESALGKLRS